MKNKTCIIISPRVSSIKGADKILILDGGKIIESGSHDELIKLQGKYFNLYELQKN
jgi:ABC-type multidrug transport system fused ATPase/permease subunit